MLVLRHRIEFLGRVLALDAATQLIGRLDTELPIGTLERRDEDIRRVLARRSAALRWLLPCCAYAVAPVIESAKKPTAAAAWRCVAFTVLTSQTLIRSTPPHALGFATRCFFLPWAKRDSNPRHPACKAGALTN